MNTEDKRLEQLPVIVFALCTCCMLLMYGLMSRSNSKMYSQGIEDGQKMFLNHEYATDSINREANRRGF